jgi:hypothetical protein
VSKEYNGHLSIIETKEFTQEKCNWLVLCYGNEIITKQINSLFILAMDFVYQTKVFHKHYGVYSSMKS